MELQKDLLKEEKKEIKNNNSKEINFDFIQKILKNNIGSLVDDFIKHNQNVPVGKYNGSMFVLWIIDSINKSTEEIISEFKKNIK